MIAVTFDTPDDFLAFVLGPPRHDQHVQAFRRHQHLTRQAAWLDAADARVNAAIAEMIARRRKPEGAAA